MAHRTRPLGRVAVFLLPSLKIRQTTPDGSSVQSRLETFLLDTFGGYTAEAGNIWGRWRGEDGHEDLGEHRRFTVAVERLERLPLLLEELARIAQEIGEQAIYVESGSEAWLVSPVAEGSGGDRGGG